MPLMTARTAATLARWLGPWAGTVSPRGVVRETVALHPAGEGRAYVYPPAGAAAGAYLVLPGLHFAGPDDPRLDRFCRVLAKSGLLVVAPFIGSYTRLVLDPSALTDAEAAYELAETRARALGVAPPALFSVSFGSLLAFHLAQTGRPRAAMIFGGFAEFLPTVRFAVTGRTTIAGHPVPLDVERDPLNAPVVFLNLLPHLAMDGDREALRAAWLEMVYRTWGKMELKAKGARDPIAHEIAAGLAPELRVPFLRGCVLEEGAIDWLETGLEAGARTLSFLDPVADRARCPIVLVHGLGDDVIPYYESMKLFRAIPHGCHAGFHVTGMYGHTGAARPSVSDATSEVVTMARMLIDLARAPRR